MSYLKYDGTIAAVTANATTDFFGHDGAETINGTSGADSLWLDAGDVGRGGAGDDTYWLKALKGQFTAVELPGGGIDKVAGWQNINLADYANFENVYVGGDKTYGAGNADDNVIEGGAGSQQLYGGGGQDVLIGGAGADIFIVKKGEGNDAIQDFNVAEDKVRLSAGFTTFAQVKSHLVQVGNDVKLDMGDGDGLMFRNVTVDQFTAANFQLQLDASTLGAKTFGDEFNGPLSIWDAQSNPTGTWRTDFGYQGEQGVGSYSLVSNNEQQIYISPYFRGHNGDFASPFTSNADGTLTITAQASSSSEIFGYQYTSGMITTQPTFAQTYGYFEMRADLPSTAGAWPAFWLIPADGSWPPELDVMETLTTDPNASWTTEHSGLGAGGHSSNGIFSFVPDTTDGFHTYGALWTKTDLVWYIDGVEVFHTATPADMNKPMFMIANLALGGWGGAIDNAHMPAELKIDYIRAYALGDGSTASTPATPAPVTPAPVVTPPPVTAPPVTTPAADPAASSSSAGLVLGTGVYADTLTGGAGTDTITAGQGPDKMTGGAGADVFVFNKLAWTAGHITDFQVGVDKIDFSALLSASHYAGSDAVADGYVKLIDNGAGGTWIYYDTDGNGSADQWGTFMTTLDGVGPGSLNWASLTSRTGATGATGAASNSGAAGGGGGLALIAASGGDTLSGGESNDTISGGAGSDFLRGMGGADTLSGGGSFDRINGNQGNDVVHGDGGADWVSGGQDNDYVFGDDGDDILNGNLGSDTVDGGVGNDIVRGGQGDDLLTGGAGNDWLSGDLGNDTMSGGLGADTFHMSMGGGVDRVLDFNVAEGDRVQLDPGMTYTVHQDGADTVIDVGNGSEMVLVGVNMSSLGSGWIFGA